MCAVLYQLLHVTLIQYDNFNGKCKQSLKFLVWHEKTTYETYCET